MGRHEEALQCFRKSLDHKIQVQGAGHPDVATAHHNSGLLLREMGKGDEARESFQQTRPKYFLLPVYEHV